MNITRFYILLSFITLVCGVIFFGIYNHMIIFSFSPLHTNEVFNNSFMQKKVITLYYFHNEKWKTEKQELLWSKNKDRNILNLINSWLSFMDEEHIIPKKITVQSVLISQAQCAYISFDHNVFNKQDSIFKKWMLVEGILKTIRLNDISVQDVCFLVQHQPLQDMHLDFSLPWQGFI